MRKFLSLLLALLMLPLPGALAAEKYETLPEHMQMTQSFEHERLGNNVSIDRAWPVTVNESVNAELRAALDYARSMWKRVGVRAISLGAYMALTAFADEAPLDMCLLSSPLVDMERMIKDMMAASGVSEARLEKEREIPAGDQTLSWDDLCWTRAHPVHAVSPRTFILCAEGDALIPRETVETFARKACASLTLLPQGEHWLHTPDELAAMGGWETRCLKALM